MENSLISNSQIEQFKRDGFLILKSFYDAQGEIGKIQFGIWGIIRLMIKKYNLSIVQDEFNPNTFDSGYQEMIAINRRFGAEVYDAIKQIPSFMRLVCKETNEELFKQIRQTNLAGIGKGSYGIRIDNPHEEKFRATWHQDYLAQFGSEDGLVFWSPLKKLYQEMGPVQFCIGSHVDGVVPVYTHDKRNTDKSGAYALVMESELERIKRYSLASPLSEPGDLILIDFLTIHASGYNVSNESRWSMQFRYFNFNHQSGIDMGWRGGYANGITLHDVLPQYVLD